MALTALVKSSQFVNSELMRSRMTSGSRPRHAGMRRPAGSGTSLARVKALSAQMTCESSSRPSTSRHIPSSSSFKTCPVRILLLSWADLEDAVFFGQRTMNTLLTSAQVALSTIGKASNHSSAVFPDFNLLANAVVFFSSVMVSFRSLLSNFLIKSCGFSPARPFP